MPEIRIYFASDGRVHIYWPEGIMPLESEIQAICDAIEQHRKSPSACANMQKGSTENGTKGQTEYTAPGAENQELQELFKQLTEEQQKAALKRMRDIKEGRA